MGSAIIANIDANLDKTPQLRAQALKNFIADLSSGMVNFSLLSRPKKVHNIHVLTRTFYYCNIV